MAWSIHSFNAISRITDSKGTVRGLHYQHPPASEVKLVRCTTGALCDVIVDLRPDSPTYTQHFAVDLSAANRLALYIPEGFAHGFQTLEDDSEVLYQMSEFYSPEQARGCGGTTRAPAFDWPIAAPIISDKDRSWTPLRTPDYVPLEIERTFDASTAGARCTRWWRSCTRSVGASRATASAGASPAWPRDPARDPRGAERNPGVRLDGPNEWNIRDAYIQDEHGRRVVDFQRCNLHVVNYSVPGPARMTLDELRPRLHSLPDRPTGFRTAPRTTRRTGVFASSTGSSRRSRKASTRSASTRASRPAA